jgi:VWFA-related protein
VNCFRTTDAGHASSLPFCFRFPLRRQPDEPTFSTEVKVVNILATVRTKSGQIINDLTKDDFSLTENKRPQEIRYFSRESDLPLTIGLMVDTSMSQARVLESERSASFQFVDQVLREGKDKVFVTQFDMAVMTRQKPTSSRRDLEESLPYVDTPSKNELQAQRGGGTLLFRCRGEGLARDHERPAESQGHDYPFGRRRQRQRRDAGLGD